MSTQTIFLFAMGVFLLMCIGLFLTALEFNRLSEDPSKRKGEHPSRASDTEQAVTEQRPG